MDAHNEHRALVAELTRRGFLRRTGLLGVGALVLSATPLARQLAEEARAQGGTPLADATLEAFADTMIPGRKAATTDLGDPIDPRSVAGVDSLPGAVEAGALRLYHHPAIGFDALEGPFLADLGNRSLARGGDFLGLPFDKRVEVCVEGLAFSNSIRVIWEAAAAVPFTAFCAATLVPEQRAEKASGYAVMGLPGAEPRGYSRFSYRRRLARGRTRKGSMP